MSNIGTKERSPKAEHRLKIPFAGPVFQLVDLRLPEAPDANYFHGNDASIRWQKCTTPMKRM
jgi:hypothetical protein